MQEFTGLEYLKIDIASNFGLDKKDWDERIAWTDAHEDQLESLVQQAEEPALYFAGVQAYRKTQKGEPTGYPISLDAASSGLQLLACLVGCADSARLCGVISTGHRADSYTILYNHMCQAIGDVAKIERKDTKKAIMTSLYASTAEPKRIFGEGRLLEVFYETMEKHAPGAWELNQVLQQLWQPYALSHDWVLPDNFHAHVKVEETQTEYVQFLNRPVAVSFRVNQGTKEGRSIGPNIVHSIDGMIVREMHRRCDFDRDRLIDVHKMVSGPVGGTRMSTEDDRMVMRLAELHHSSGFLSARILDHLTFDNLGLVDREALRRLLMSMPEKPFHVISIHDCFRCLPNYGNDLRRQYNQLLSEIAGSKMLEFIASQITGRYVPVQKMGDLSALILQADYALS